MINLVKGDIFNAPNTFSFAQCVSKDSHQGMFRGIAVEFLKRFPALKVLRGKVLVEGLFLSNIIIIILLCFISFNCKVYRAVNISNI